MTVSKISKKQLITSKAKQTKEISINCLECGRNVIDLLKFQDKEYNKIYVQCVCGTQFPVKSENRCKIQAAEGYIINDINYELLTKPLVTPRRGETYVSVKKN